jgi:hypothetical protein
LSIESTVLGDVMETIEWYDTASRTHCLGDAYRIFANFTRGRFFAHARIDAGAYERVSACSTETVRVRAPLTGFGGPSRTPRIEIGSRQDDRSNRREYKLRPSAARFRFPTMRSHTARPVPMPVEPGIGTLSRNRLSRRVTAGGGGGYGSGGRGVHTPGQVAGDHPDRRRSDTNGMHVLVAGNASVTNP